MIKAAKLIDNAIIPMRHSIEAAGCDIHSANAGTIAPKTKAIINSGISLDVPEGYVAMLYGRSGLSNKFLLEVINVPVYPNDNREVLVYMYNNGNVPFTYNQGERIAQVVFVEVEKSVEIEKY